MKSVLVASSDREACNVIRKALEAEYDIFFVSTFTQCLEKFQRKRYELTFIDVAYLQEFMENNTIGHYKSVLQLFWNAFPSAHVIVLAPQKRIRHCVDVVKAGASNYLTFPLDIVELKHVIANLYETELRESELEHFRSNFWQKDSLELIQTKSPVMESIYKKVMAVAPTRTTVLLTGETGTGKGVMAKLIHAHSNRKENTFVSVHCGAISDNLVESELFGHEKGSFTGAIGRKHGKFEIAQDGTIFLDEIATVSPSIQIKLLNILQEKTFQRVGGVETIDCDVRIIAATNVDLKKMCADGTFRQDLYYRLNVFPIEIPPLREREEDIPFLADVFLRRLNTLYTKNIRRFHPDVIDALKKYPWPGNIREMEHLIERAYILEHTSLLTTESFPIELFTFDTELMSVPVNTSMTLAAARQKALDDVEQQYLKQVLREHNGRINKTAQSAGITTRQIHKLLKKHGIDKNQYK